MTEKIAVLGFATGEARAIELNRKGGKLQGRQQVSTNENGGLIIYEVSVNGAGVHFARLSSTCSLLSPQVTLRVGFEDDGIGCFTPKDAEPMLAGMRIYICDDKDRAAVVLNWLQRTGRLPY